MMILPRILHTTEPDTFAPRRGTIIDTIVVHTTDTSGFPREIPADDQAKQIRYIKRAKRFGGISAVDAKNLLAEFGGTQPKAMSDALALCLTAASWNRRASWHYCIASEPEGSSWQCEVVELVDPALQAHHVGALGLRTNLRSIGIENMYPGALPRTMSQETATEKYRRWGWEGAERLRGPDGRVRWYTRQSAHQKNELLNLCLDLVLRFPTITAVVNHHQFAPSRRIDPDPPVDLGDLRYRLLYHTHRTFAAKPIGKPRRA